MPALGVCINDIAPELLGRIFEVRVEQAQDDGSALLELARVCAHWKGVAFHHPRLWATHHPKYRPTAGRPRNHDVFVTKQFVDHLEQWFARAGNLPLSLDVTFSTPPTSAFLLYLLNCPRWKSLRLHGTSGGFEWEWLPDLQRTGKGISDAKDGRPCWPALTFFHIDTPSYTTIGQGVTFSFNVASLHLLAPNLKILSLEVLAMNTPTAILGFNNFSWENLTQFTFHGMDEDRNPTFIYHILTQAKNLESLSLKHPRSTLRDSPPSTVTIRPAPRLPIAHKKLRHLVLGLSEDLLKAITQNVQLPSMYSLQLITTSLTSERAGQPPLWFFPLLHRVSYASPLFWPRLGEFIFGRLGDTPLTLKQGDGDFESFKGDPASWWAKRLGYE